MDSQRVISIAGAHLASLAGHRFDVLALAKPVSQEAALNLAKVISKLSPLLGNLIEFNTVEFLNGKSEFEGLGRWRRQDPDFPDAVFEGNARPTPGMEIKAWFPLATEITARFRESQNYFTSGRTITSVCMLAWLPEHLLYGRPYILDVVVVDGLSVAKSRDDHYHNPPDYLVLEPEDTRKRTRNLRQTNTNGYKFQGTPQQLDEAKRIVDGWGARAREYKTTPEYQRKLRTLTSAYKYRLDTNYAKMDRVAHAGVEAFKTRVCRTEVKGMSVASWAKLLAPMKPRATPIGEDAQQQAGVRTLSAQQEAAIKAALAEHLQIGAEHPGKLLV